MFFIALIRFSYNKHKRSVKPIEGSIIAAAVKEVKYALRSRRST